MSRCILKGEINFKNGRYRKFEGEIPLQSEVNNDINFLDLAEFFNENKSINRRLIYSITGECFDVNTGRKLRVILL